MTLVWVEMKGNCIFLFTVCGIRVNATISENGSRYRCAFFSSDPKTSLVKNHSSEIHTYFTKTHVQRFSLYSCL